MTAFAMFIALFGLLAVGMPIGFALAFSGTAGLFIIGGPSLVAGILEQAPRSAVAHYELLTVPMFILMGEFIMKSGIAVRLFEAAAINVGRMPGGLAIATMLFGAGFGAICGTSVASAATLASTSAPTMIRLGYDRRFATGVVAISGTLAMLIPPSLALILYSLLTELSTAKLLIAGLMPGLVVAIGIALTIWFLIWRDPSLGPSTRSYGWSEKIRALRLIGPVLLLMVFIACSLYFGIATPVETSAIGAFLAFCIALYNGTMNFQIFVSGVSQATRTTAMIAIILIGAAIFGYAMTLTQATQSIVSWTGDLDINRYAIVAIIIALLLLLGCVLDQTAILVLTVPIVVPVVVSLGFDPIWFGVIFVVAGEVGMVTPPVGLNVYIVSKYAGVPAGEVFVGVVPHVIAHILMLALFVIFPQIIVFLPSQM
jgi:tripartite ATP-independent transporter DctM subunit